MSLYISKSRYAINWRYYHCNEVGDLPLRWICTSAMCQAVKNCFVTNFNKPCLIHPEYKCTHSSCVGVVFASSTQWRCFHLNLVTLNFRLFLDSWLISYQGSRRIRANLVSSQHIMALHYMISKLLLLQEVNLLLKTFTFYFPWLCYPFI